MAYNKSHLVSEDVLAALQEKGEHKKYEMGIAFNDLIRQGVDRREAAARVQHIGGRGITQEIQDAGAAPATSTTRRASKTRKAKGLPTDIREAGGAMGGEAAWDREDRVNQVLSDIGQPEAMDFPTEAASPHYESAPDAETWGPLKEQHQELSTRKNLAASGKGPKLSESENKEQARLNNIIYGTSGRQGGTRLEGAAITRGYETARLNGDKPKMEAERARFAAHLSQRQLTAGDVDEHIDFPIAKERGYSKRTPGTLPDMQVCLRSDCDSPHFPAYDLADANPSTQPLDSTLCPACNEGMRTGALAGDSSDRAPRGEILNVPPADPSARRVRPGDPEYKEGAARFLKHLFLPGAYTSPEESARIHANVDEMFGKTGDAAPVEKTVGPSGAVVPKTQPKPGEGRKSWDNLG